MWRKIVLKVNGFLSIPQFHENPREGFFLFRKTSLMHSKLLRNAKLRPEIEKLQRQIQEVLFKRGFSCMLWIMETRQKREKLLMHPPKCFSIIHENSDGKIFLDVEISSLSFPDIFKFNGIKSGRKIEIGGIAEWLTWGFDGEFLVFN